MTLSDGTEWVWVPRRLSAEMRIAMVRESKHPNFHNRSLLTRLVDAHNEAIAAAPQPPVEEMERIISDEILFGFHHQATVLQVARAIVKRLMGKG